MAKVTGGTVDEAMLERAGEETRRMGLADRIHFWDKKQSAKVWVDAQGEPVADDAPGGPRHHLERSGEVMLCLNDHTHGAMWMHGNGSVLMCCFSKNGAGCTASMPVSV